METGNRKNILIAVVVIAVAIVIGYLIAYCTNRNNIENTTANVYNAPKIAVHVKGAVANPGIYEFDSGKRVNDAVEAAGGALENADLNSINLAKFLEDAAEVIVPYKKDGASPEVETETAQESSKININTASSGELCELPGIGVVTAGKIIKYRTEKGAFNRIEEIMNVSGIGEKTFESIKDSICVR